MADSLATLLQRAIALETSLADATRIASASIWPPFTQSRRMEILDAFASCRTLHSQFSLVIQPLLQSTELRGQHHNHPDRAYLRALLRRLDRWKTTYGLMEHVIHAPKILLPRPHPSIDSPLAQQVLAFDGLLYRLHQQLVPLDHNAAQPEGHHADIPMGFARFFQLIQFARRLALAAGRTSPLSFLDVGCGIGLKILGAGQVFEIAHGFDFDPDYIQIAEGLVHQSTRPEDHAFHANGLTFDRYGEYDVIYAYQPMADEALQMQMDHRIATLSRPGTVLIMPHVQFPYRPADNGCHPVHGPIYLAGHDTAQAKPILRRLANIGHVVPLPAPQHSDDDRLAHAMTNALRAFGHLA